MDILDNSHLNEEEDNFKWVLEKSEFILQDRCTRGFCSEVSIIDE